MNPPLLPLSTLPSVDRVLARADVAPLLALHGRAPLPEEAIRAAAVPEAELGREGNVHRLRDPSAHARLGIVGKEDAPGGAAGLQYL